MSDDPDLSFQRRVARFSEAWRAGTRPRLEEHLAQTSGDARERLFQALLKVEFEYRASIGEQPDLLAYAERFPDLLETESLALAGGNTVARPSAPSASSVATEVRSRGAGLPAGAPATLGRYEVHGVLGRGGFGTVYLGYDAQLERQVAIKTARENTGSTDQDPAVTENWGQLVNNERFLREARRVARLRHPAIASVHDVGVDSGYRFIVSDLIDGTTLRA